MSLDDIENRLYSRTPPPLHETPVLQSEERGVRIAPGWTAEAERKQSALYGIIARIMPWLNRILIASTIFFLFAGGVALVGLWRGSNTVSPQNISLSALGPVAAPAGEELAYEITVGNYNETELSSVDLLVEYPDDTRKSGALSEPLLRYRESLGALAARATVARRLSLVPFGEQGAVRKILVTVEYRAKGSNAIFSRQSEYDFTINAAPVTVTVTAPREVSPTQPFTVSFEISSNSSATIQGLLVKAEYPPGFRLTGSVPAPAFNDSVWQLGDLAPQAKRTLRVTGQIDAAEADERAFRFLVGTAEKNDEKTIGTLFFIESHSVTLTKPPVSIDAVINGTRGDIFAATKTGPFRVDLPWINNLGVKLTDLEITAKFDGTIYDSQSVAGSGRYDATTGTIVFDKRELSSLGVIDPGEDGTASFSFSLLPFTTDPSRFKNASLLLHIFVRGNRLDETGAVQEVVSTLTKEIRIASTLSLGTRLSFASGPFTNSGPLPPKVGQETTFTVTWSLSNSSNGVAGAKVSATLPPYVRWLGVVSPPSEKVSYSPEGGTVVWEAGDMSAGVGFGSSPKEVSFQVSLLPSTGQTGTAPVVIGVAQATAQDRFTNAETTSNSRPALTTAALIDGGSGIVGQ